MTRTYASLAEYGTEFRSGQDARRWLRSCEQGAPRPIRSAGEYVAACRELISRHGLPDEWSSGLALEPGYQRVAPAVWLGLREERAGVQDQPPVARWLAYWDATQPRPGSPGSPYNDDPADAATAWRLGIPVSAYPRGYAHLLSTGRGLAGPQRIRAVLALARRLPDEGWRMPHSTRDLRALARMRPAFLRWLLGGRRADQWMIGAWDGRDWPHKVAWPALGRLHRQWLAVTADGREIAYRALRLPAEEWPEEPEPVGALRAQLRVEARHDLADARLYAAAADERQAELLAAADVAERQLAAATDLAGLAAAREVTLALAIRASAACSAELVWERHVAPTKHELGQSIDWLDDCWGRWACALYSDSLPPSWQGYLDWQAGSCLVEAQRPVYRVGRAVDPRDRRWVRCIPSPCRAETVIRASARLICQEIIRAADALVAAGHPAALWGVERAVDGARRYLGLQAAGLRPASAIDGGYCSVERPGSRWGALEVDEPAPAAERCHRLARPAGWLPPAADAAEPEQVGAPASVALARPVGWAAGLLPLDGHAARAEWARLQSREAAQRAAARPRPAAPSAAQHPGVVVTREQQAAARAEWARLQSREAAQRAAARPRPAAPSAAQHPGVVVTREQQAAARAEWAAQQEAERQAEERRRRSAAEARARRLREASRRPVVDHRPAKRALELD